MHPATRLHDVRHAVETELGRRGVHPVIVSAVSDTSPAFTIAVYQHDLAGGAVRGRAGPRGGAGPLPRWQPVGTGGIRTLSGPGRCREVAGQTRWGGQDSNLRPADYERRVLRPAALASGQCLTCSSRTRRLGGLPVVSRSIAGQTRGRSLLIPMRSGSAAVSHKRRVGGIQASACRPRCWSRGGHRCTPRPG